ncbi:MAG: tetratricopeptide repeat protein, partial [Methanothrix sp.]
MKEIGVGKRQKNNWLWASLAFSLLALAALSTSALAQENSAESWYKNGQELERMGSWQEAIDAYDQAIKLNSEYEEAWCAKCKALSNANLELSGEEQNVTFAEAIQACDKAIDIDPANARSWSGKGFVLYQEAFVTADPGKFNESLLAYEKAIEVAGSDTSALSEAWRGKGTVLSQMGRSGEALAAQEKAIELNGSDLYAWMGKAMALSELGRNEESVQSFDKIIELYPSEDQRIFDYPYIWYSKGRVLEKLGRDEEAAHAYNRSIEDVDTIIGWVASGRDFYMNLSEAWQYKGQLLEEQGRYEEAVQALENATRITPEGLRDWHELGTVLARDLGRYNQSLEAYDRALQLDPMDGDILTEKANVLRSLGRYDEALEHYEKVLQLDMQSPHSFFYLAKAWLGKGEILRIQGKYNESFLA